jgi:hypothetical protein
MMLLYLVQSVGVVMWCDVGQAMGSSVWMSGRRPRIGGLRGRIYSERHAAMVVSLFGHVNGVERTVGDPVLARFGFGSF